MSDLRRALENYLKTRQSLGFKLRLTTGHLHRFIDFLEAEGACYITTDLALRWAKQPADAQPATWAGRLGMVRRFASWHSASDPRTQVPPEQLLPYRYCRKQPYIYTDSEIEGIVLGAGQLLSPMGLRAHTYSTLFGLLAVTGMRINEALGLDQEDVDLAEGDSHHSPYEVPQITAGADPHFLRGGARLLRRKKEKHSFRSRPKSLFCFRTKDSDHRMEHPIQLRENLSADRAPGNSIGPWPGPKNS